MSLNSNKIAFIVLYNNKQYLDECDWYINRLIVPEKMTVEKIFIKDAPSMCSGYNKGMNVSDAMYKIYLHQDVFIIDVNFITHVIQAFINNPEYALIGMIGGDIIPSNGSAYDHWNLGAVFTFNNHRPFTLSYGYTTEKDLLPAQAVDGFLIATSCDILWREDVFTGFDFYDISQCMEFQRNGYKIGVLNQKKPLCIHDNGFSKLQRYDYFRKKLCSTYPENFTYDRDYTVSDSEKEYIEIAKKLTQKIDYLISINDFETAYSVIASLTHLKGSIGKLDAMIVAYHVCQKGYGAASLKKMGSSVSEIIDTLNNLKFILWRSRIGDTAAIDDLKAQALRYNVTEEMITALKEHFLHDY